MTSDAGRGRPGRVLAVIPARGGSKTLPRKNVRLLGGRPLIQYTIDAARGSRFRPRVIVSTDDPEIADLAAQRGAEVPFLRPEALAGDSTPTVPVVAHALQVLAARDGYTPETVMVLQPTSPLRRAIHIDEAIDLWVSSGADSVVSVCETEHSPYWMRLLDEEGRLHPLLEGSQAYQRRQDLPRIYRLTGAIYITRPDLVGSPDWLGDDSRGYVMPQEDSVDIDTEANFLLAAWRLEHRS